jgi:hypothetical protein
MGGLVRLIATVGLAGLKALNKVANKKKKSGSGLSNYYHKRTKKNPTVLSKSYYKPTKGRPTVLSKYYKKK